MRLSLALLILFVALIAIAARHQTPSALPSPVQGTASRATVAPRVTPSVASRSRKARPLNWRVRNVTCYVATGHRTASGVWPREGMAASNLYPFGTHLRVGNLGVFTVTDRVGHGSDVDLFYSQLGSCIKFGRRHLRVAVIR